jgi:hypothetical protein
MAPSKGYVKLNGNPPTIVEDAEGLFYQILGVNDGRTPANEELPVDVLEKWLEKVKEGLNVAGEGAQYLYVHCPFHHLTTIQASPSTRQNITPLTTMTTGSIASNSWLKL